jgi:hypothetical protein
MRCAAEALVIAVALSLGACKDDGAPAGETGGDDSGDDSGTGDGAGSDASGSGESGSGEPAGDTEADLGPWESLEARPCPDDSFLTFENFGAIHLLNYCTGCHASGLPADQRQGAPLTIVFDGIDDVRAHADRIWARAGDHNATMPPAGAAPESERALLGEWLACGAPTDAELAGD